MSEWYQMPYNYSNGTSVGGVGDFFMKYPSFILGNYLAMGIITMIWVMIFGISLAVGARKSLVAASFPTFILSLYKIRLNYVGHKQQRVPGKSKKIF